MISFRSDRGPVHSWIMIDVNIFQNLLSFSRSLRPRVELPVNNDNSARTRHVKMIWRADGRGRERHGITSMDLTRSVFYKMTLGCALLWCIYCRRLRTDHLLKAPLWWILDGISRYTLSMCVYIKEKKMQRGQLWSTPGMRDHNLKLT